ncbi:15785_t:CDS:2 [Gigaspora margarita]|uniref:15785_t:CDS:1 n=1 Tax=Gigaspora margarita TaxID=4874 RepID=A0ABN7V1B9_GIGMA|nr:15785_t:CDS:2 [Gigaspora margarita]
MLKFYKKLLPTTIDEEKRNKFVDKIERILTFEWPSHEIKVIMFGSSMNFLGTSTSDIDLCVTTPSKELENMHTLSKIKMINPNYMLGNSTEEISVRKTENDKAVILKDKFENIMKYQLKIYKDQLLSTSTSLENFFTTNFDDLFDNESLDLYLQGWKTQYDKLNLTKSKVELNLLKLLYKLREPYLSMTIAMAAEYKNSMKISPSHKTLRKHVRDKMKSMLNVETRHELRYWIGTWRLIELLHITRCPVNILVESGLTSRYLTRTENTKYDQFLKDLLNDDNAYHKTPEFNEILLQKVKMLDL